MPTTADRQRQAIIDLTADLEATHIQLDSYIDAHRIILVWLLERLPDDEGRKLLSGQANVLDPDGKQEETNFLVKELDTIRDLISRSKTGPDGQQADGAAFP